MTTRAPVSQPLADAARVLAEFARTAPGRLPQRVQDALAVIERPEVTAPVDLSTVPGEVLGNGHPDWPDDLTTFAERKAYQRGVAHARAITGGALPAPLGWWTDELEKIFSAKEGTQITADMKRAAHMALTVARGGRWDDEKQEWTAPGDWIAADDVRRLTRELDELLNGPNAAKQASLCDIVAQVRSEGIRSRAGVIAAWMHVQGNHFEPSLRQLDDDEKARGWTQFPLYSDHGGAAEIHLREAIRRLLLCDIGENRNIPGSAGAIQFARSHLARGVQPVQAPGKRWPFVETPGEFTERLHVALELFDQNLLAAVRYVLIETPPTLAPGLDSVAPTVPQGYRAVPIKALVKIASLIDPAPIEVDGKRMVFKNQMAAEVLTRLSAEIRELLDHRAPAHGASTCPHGVPHRWPCEQCDALGVSVVDHQTFGHQTPIPGKEEQ